jgi:hypothetical protein
MTEARKAVRITSKVTTTFLSVPCIIVQLVIAVASEGTAFTFSLQDKGSPAKVLIPTYTVELAPSAVQKPSNPRILTFQYPVYMEGGIDIITAGTTAGEISVWIEYLQGP